VGAAVVDFPAGPAPADPRNSEGRSEHQGEGRQKAAETRLTGNLTIGDSTEDVKDGKVDCKYAGELSSDSSELRMIREQQGMLPERSISR
jgi:hypothetical protein